MTCIAASHQVAGRDDLASLLGSALCDFTQSAETKNHFSSYMSQ